MIWPFTRPPRAMRPLISMREALHSRDVFDATDPSWLPWNVMLIAAMGEPLISAEERELFAKLTGGREPPQARVEELVAVSGRRSGKTSAAARLLVYLSALCDWTACLDRGERGAALFLATTAAQATVAFQRASGIMEGSPLLRSMIRSQTQDTIALDRTDLMVRPASARGIRGITCVGVCADEAAHFLVEGTNSDTEVLTAVRPTLATTGGVMLVASSPYWERGELYELHKRHFGQQGDPKILVAQAASRVTNPTLPESVVLRALERDEAAARAEYLADFRSDITSLLDRATVEAAVDKGVTSRPPVQGLGPYVCFADSASGVAASGGGDMFSSVIAHREGEQIIIDYVFARKPPFNASNVVADVCALARGYGINEIVSDRYSVGFMAAEVARHGLTHRASVLDKSALYLNALPIFTSHAVRLLDNKDVVNQFCMLERRTSAGGRDRVDARGGRSEDSANCVAGAMSLLAKPLTGPEAFLEYMRRQCVKEGIDFNRVGTDMDPVRAPGPQFGWNLTAEPLLKLSVPPQFANTLVDGRCPRGCGAGFHLEVTRSEAARLLSVPIWREHNKNLAIELSGELV